MRRLGVIVCACTVALVVAAPVSARAARPLVTGVMDPATPAFGIPAPLIDPAYRAVAESGATVLRIPVQWSDVAPVPPAHGADPQDPAYRWSALDHRVERAHEDGLVPLLTLFDPPSWALRRRLPRPGAFGRFAAAAARRYSGTSGLPEVRLWQMWNEPNLLGYLDATGHRTVDEYRRLVNAGADAVKRVSASNRVIAGGLGPFGGPGPYGSARGTYGMRPLPFMRRLLCLSGGSPPRPTCHHIIRFDVWAHHPYTSGDPEHSAIQPGDVSLGDLGEMRRVLDAAIGDHVIRSSGHVPFWVTELSWDTNPPDGGGVPLRLDARWVSEAMYRLWCDRISTVIWFQLQDQPLRPGSIWQSGLYFYDPARIAPEDAKPALRAFRFPFVAYAAGRRAKVWGRTPRSDRRRVAIEQRVHGRWRRLARVHSDRYGIFSARPLRRGRGPLLARLSDGDASRPFSLHRPPDRFVNPFGSNAAPEH